MSVDGPAVDAAIVARLTDSALAALLPGGVYWDIGGKGLDAFVVVSLSEDATTEQFGGAAAERTVYLAKAVHRSTSGTTAADAARRIHALLQWDDDDGQAPPPLTIAGHELLALRRVERVRYTEVDGSNPDQRWQHHGGLYEVITAAQAAPAEDEHGTTTRQ